MVTAMQAVLRFIEQVGSIIKDSKAQLPSINPLIIPCSFKELAQTVHMHPPAGYYPVQN